jgi:RNA polymerase sigma-70 factor (ECF subfamily)
VESERSDRLDEALLVQGLRERKEQAVACFMERYRPLLHHCIGHFETEATARDDLYQELVLYVLERLDADRFDAAKGSLGTWLYRVAWCRCVDLKRRSQGALSTRTTGGADAIPDRPDPQPGPGDQVGEAEVGDIVRRALVRLDAQEQDLLALRYLEERTLGEIASLLGISHEQCKYRLKRASTAMRRVILNDLSLERMADEAGFLDRAVQLEKAPKS